MATVERTPSRQTSLQQMLELEKRYKLERLQGQQLPPASTPLPASYNSRPPLTTRRSESMTHHQQNYLMLKAVQRSVALPSLSITIPPDGGDQKRGTSTERTANKENQVDKETVVEPLHKQVKFLAPDDDDLSDQSSICQSPSWEGYGLKKREKKQEAERKKKEKEQQDKETKAAKRRLAARLSKAPPRPVAPPPPIPVAHAERSLSDTQLLNRRLRVGPFSTPLADIEQGRTSSGEDAQDTKASAGSDVNSDQSNGGPKLEQEREVTLNGFISQQALAMASNVPKGRQQMQKSHSSPGTAMSSIPAVSTSKEAKQSRDLHPPSASRTPMLRQASATTHSRSNSLLSGASKMFHRRERSRSEQRVATSNHSQESLHATSSGAERGRNDNSYVQHQRDQSKDRAMSGLVEDQLIRNASSQPPVTKGNTRQGLSRRSSLTVEARSVAARFSVLKSTSGSKGSAKSHHGRSQSSTDYFTFLEQPYSPPALEPLSPIGSLPASMRDKSSQQESTSTKEPQATEGPYEEESEDYEDRGRPTIQPRDASSSYSKQFLFPTTSMQPIVLSAPPSKTPSIASSGSAPSKKGRSFKDAFAALSMHRASMPPTPLESPAPPKSPPHQLRARMSTNSYGMVSTSQITSAPMALSPPLATLQLPPKAARVLGEYNEPTAASGQSAPSGNAPIKTTTIPAHSGSRVSEGSSSSSAYDDASPLPSPATTPDTSRPQSSKGLPAAADPSSSGGADSDTMQDDEKTVREASDSSGGSTRTGTPRLEISQPREKKSMTEEEQWSRTALPLDLDFDAQSFVTSFSNLDNIDSIDDELAKARLLTASPRQELLAAQAAKVNGKRSQERLHIPGESWSRSKTLSNPDLRNTSEAATGLGLVFGANNEAMIPPRSKRREQAAARPSTAPMDSHLEGLKQDVKEKNRDAPELKTFKEFQAQEKERGSKPRRQDAKLERSRETARRDTRHGRIPEMPDSPQDESHKPKRQHKNEQLRDVAREDQPNMVEDMEQSDSSVEAINPLTADLHRTTTAKSVDDSSSSIYSSHSFGASNRTSTSGAPSAPESPNSAAFLPETSSSPRSKSPTASIVLPAPAQPAQEATLHPRSAPASHPAKPASKPAASVSAPATPAASPNSRPVGNGPVSILKQTSRSQSPPASHRGPMLSAIPKHMQVQAGMSSRPPVAVTDQRVAPIAKMFVECCSCKFYHDMPSKLYECMAKPDAVVEDKLLGISGAITTMVKCPWCTHNMTTQCCAGYAAVVYLKERLH